MLHSHEAAQLAWRSCRLPARAVCHCCLLLRCLRRPPLVSLSLAAAWLQMVTASGDGLLKIWNIAVRYHMDEDPKVGLML